MLSSDASAQRDWRGLSNTIEVTNALVELSRACKTTIVTLRRYGDSIVHRVIFTRMFVDRLVKGVGIHYGILRREDGDFVIYLALEGASEPAIACHGIRGRVSLTKARGQSKGEAG